MTLTPHQSIVFNNILSDIDSFNDFGQCFIGSLVGPAGCGKTVLTTMLIQEFYKTHYVTCATPTHKSLSVLDKMLKNSKIFNSKLNSRTIHSYLGLKIEYEEDKIKLAMDALQNNKFIDKTEILIIDESSMVSQELYDFLEKKIKSQKLKVVLFIGDEYQLLPVEGTKNPVYSKIKQYRLTEVVRQALDSNILQYATAIRKEIENKTFNKNVLLNVSPSEDVILYNDEVQLIKDFCFNTNDNKILSAFTNSKTDYYNAFIRSYVFRELPVIPELVEGELVVLQSQFLSYKNGEEVFITNLNKKYDEALDVYYWSFCPSDSTEELKIICKESMPIFSAKLKELSDKAKTFKRDKYYKECSETWNAFWGLKNSYAEIKHNYGSTIHKLQGSTYDDVYLNLSETIKVCRDNETLFRLVYVAVTRAKNNLKIFK